MEIHWQANKERSVGGDVQLISLKKTIVVERKSEETNQELARLCRIADYAGNLKIGDFLKTRLARNSLKKFVDLVANLTDPQKKKAHTCFE